MTIGRKLYLSFGGTIALLGILGLVSWISLGALGKAVNKLTNVNARKLYLAGDLSKLASDMVGFERGILLCSYMKDSATAAAYNQGFTRSLAKCREDVAEFTPLIETVAGRHMIGEITRVTSDLEDQHQAFYKSIQGGQLPAAVEMLRTQVNPKAMLISETGTKLVNQQNGLFHTVALRCEDIVAQSKWGVGTAIALALVLGFIVVRIVKQINDTLRQATAELLQNAAEVSSAAAEVAASSQSLAQGSSQQAASLEETSASTQEISAMTSKNSENTAQAAALAQSSDQRLADTTKLLDKMGLAMGQIIESSDKIQKIINVVESIAFQTNILALNAAVEAARAGEAGAGFAVVADEVRSLSHRCAQAASDTSQLIQNSIASSGQGRLQMENVSKAIHGLVSDSGQIRMLLSDIRMSGQEQDRGIQQISRAAVQMETVTQSTAANAEETAAAAEQLTAQSLSLKSTVGSLAALVGA